MRIGSDVLAIHKKKHYNNNSKFECSIIINISRLYELLISIEIPSDFFNHIAICYFVIPTKNMELKTMIHAKWR